MNRLALLFPALLAGSVAWGQAQEQPLRDFGFDWAIDGTNGGPSSGWGGAELRAATVEDGHKRRPGPAQRSPLSIALGRSVEPVTQEWLRASLAGESPAKNLDFVELNQNKTPRQATRYGASKVAEVVIAPISLGDQITYGDD